MYTKKSQFSDYQGQPYLTNQAQSITALFEDDAVMESLSRKGEYFPSEYLARENVDDLFRDNQDIRQFDDFYHFQNVKQLDRTFENAYIESITLPKSIERIGSDAFSACYGLKTISLSCDTVPVLGEAAFRDLPDDFQILVPKNLCKLNARQLAMEACQVAAVCQPHQPRPEELCRRRHQGGDDEGEEHAGSRTGLAGDLRHTRRQVGEPVQ